MVPHTFWVNQIRLKAKASYAGWEQYNDTYRLKVIVDGVSNYFGLTGGMESVTIETYLKLLQQFGND
jgi:hypothetical protein